MKNCVHSRVRACEVFINPSDKAIRLNQKQVGYFPGEKDNGLVKPK